jgi:hypothetical protein
MTTTTLDTAMSGPPPVATRHDHRGVIVMSIEWPGPGVVAACRSLCTGSCSTTSESTGAWSPR